MHRTSAAFLAALDWQAGTTVLAPTERVPGGWVGAPSAVNHEGTTYLAYRMRRPVGQGRGFANVIARWDEGAGLQTLAVVDKDRHRTDSLERPCLIRTDNSWRLYISCATSGSNHWRVDLLEAATIEGLPDASPRTVLPGDEREGVKDPVIVRDSDGWHLWASCHPLDDPDATDRMITRYATSDDGVTWIWHSVALAGAEGSWDARGVRFTAVVPTEEGYLAFYDGRETAVQNWEERTGAAVAASLRGPWHRLDGPVFVSPHGGLRYLCTLDEPGRGTRVFYESAAADGSHELRTQLITDEQVGVRRSRG